MAQVLKLLASCRALFAMPQPIKKKPATRQPTVNNLLTKVVDNEEAHRKQIKQLQQRAQNAKGEAHRLEIKQLQQRVQYAKDAGDRLEQLCKQE